ncbi:hypothetical protein Vafri_17671 [Volvox africanus]|uniref:Damage-control phosphatase ARMT1-like metal-binding domain-containing protein n=1 Tax=Volvox africanus TaxID=51714 RepID=A0A8J4BQZ5_9CHLO|nr:hypothetical protein Vafri_17671 [Volvox africanus]
MALKNVQGCSCFQLLPNNRAFVAVKQGSTAPIRVTGPPGLAAAAFRSGTDNRCTKVLHAGSSGNSPRRSAFVSPSTFPVPALCLLSCRPPRSQPSVRTAPTCTSGRMNDMRSNTAPDPTTATTTVDAALELAGLAGMPALLRSSEGTSDGLPLPPYTPLVGSETSSFAHTTITVRLPAILESMIRDVEQDVAGMASAAGWGKNESDQAAAAVAELQQLRQSMLDNAPLEQLHVSGATGETQTLLESANACLQLAASRQQQQRQQQQRDSRRRLEPDLSASAVATAVADAAADTATMRGTAEIPPSSTWLSLPWLLVECYMYAAVYAALKREPVLAGYDPFNRQKAAAWAKSAAAAAAMAAEVELLKQGLHAGAEDPSQQTSESSPAIAGKQAAASNSHLNAGAELPVRVSKVAARAAVLAGLSMALWGNKVDLSLLVNAAALDAQALAAPPPSASLDRVDGTAATAAAAVEAQSLSRVIVDDSTAVWAAIEGLHAGRIADGGECRTNSGSGGAGDDGDSGGGGGGGGEGGVRIDIILDNSGLELFADLCLADLLMSAGVADHVVLHGKPIPWFVSDTLSSDLEALLESCAAAEPPSGQVSVAAWDPVRRAAARWRAHLAAGRWRWEAHPFWCTPAPFCWMAATAPDLYYSLKKSSLVIFKGDLNYRKLTHDCRWPHTTSFNEALQGFHPAPLVALRTLKADVVVGLAEGQSEQLSRLDTDWLVNGKWGMVQAVL